MTDLDYVQDMARPTIDKALFSEFLWKIDAKLKEVEARVTGGEPVKDKPLSEYWGERTR